ncbi:MAG: GntR family transcriptional regulator, partial [Phycisphaerales bacterium]|nr:GntR family transcriptional regulator [Phycisphaerales bacterium]
MGVKIACKTGSGIVSSLVAQTLVTQTPATAERGDEPSLNTVVYKTIKNRILHSLLRPGNKLGHQELAESLGVSRTPVREALERLQQEGFVVRRPRRGYFVAEIEAGEARDLYEIREALETYALRRAAVVGLTRAKVRELDAILKKYAELVRDNVMRQRLVVDRDFHLALGAIPGNRVLSNSLEAVYERIVLKIRTEGFRTTRGEEGYKEHVA